MKANVGFSDKEIMKAQKKYAKMSDEELCEMIRKKTQELGRTPRVGEIPAARDIKRRLGSMAQSTGKGRGKRTVRNISEKGRSPQSKKIEEERSLSKRVKNCDRIIGNI